MTHERGTVLWESHPQSWNATLVDLSANVEEHELEKSGKTRRDSEMPINGLAKELTSSAVGDCRKATETTVQEDGSGGIETGEPPHGRLLPLGRFIIVYACLGLSMFLTSLDQTIVACILPSISSEFGARNAPWVGIAFLLLQTTFSPCYGRMSDVFGRKPLILTALIIFLIGTAICGVAPTVEVLIIARAIAGIGGAGLLSMVHICISDIVTLRKRGVYHGLISAVNGAGSVLGPVAGGVFALSPKLGWRWAFYFQLPLIAFATIATMLALPSLGSSDRRLLGEKLRTLDFLGSLLFVGGTTLFLLGLLFLSPPEVPFENSLVIIPFFIGIAMLIGFCIWEIKFAIQPIVPFQIFAVPAIDQIYFLNFVFGYAFFAILYYLPEFYQVVAGQSAVQASLSLMPVVLTSIALSWLSGLLTSITGRYKWSIFIGLALQLLGSSFLYSHFKPKSKKATEIVVMIILGLGFGSQMQSNLIACQSATNQKMLAVSTSVRNFCRNMGGVFGIAFSDQIGAQADHVIDLYSRALRDTFLVYIPLTALAFLIATIMKEYSLQRSQEGEPVPLPGMHLAFLHTGKKLFLRMRGQDVDAGQNFARRSTDSTA